MYNINVHSKVGKAAAKGTLFMYPNRSTEYVCSTSLHTYVRIRMHYTKSNRLSGLVVYTVDSGCMLMQGTESIH